MQTNPKLPDDSVNVTKRHPLKEASTLIIGLVLVLIAFFALSAFFVEIAAPLVPLKTEARVLGSLWGGLEDDAFGLGVISESAELKALVDALAVHWDENPYDFNVGILEDSTPNALALPGGAILVTRGLLDLVESENELAFVLGHEIGHFRNRDHLKGLSRGALFGVVTGTVLGGNQLAEITQSLSSNTFSRNDEASSDVFGLGLVQAHYGHVSGSTDFFAKLAADESQFDKVLAKYSGTHPVSNERVEKIEAYALEQGWATDQDVKPVPDF